VLARVYAVVGEGRAPVLAVDPADEAPRRRFLPGAEMLLGASAAFLGTEPLPTGEIDLTGTAAPPADPAHLLRAARVGALRLLPA
jgi:hypothetical protein